MMQRCKWEFNKDCIFCSVHIVCTLLMTDNISIVDTSPSQTEIMVFSKDNNQMQQAIHVAANGYVGIGNANNKPQASLHVTGESIFDGGISLEGGRRLFKWDNNVYTMYDKTNLLTVCPDNEVIFSERFVVKHGNQSRTNVKLLVQDDGTYMHESVVSRISERIPRIICIDNVFSNKTGRGRGDFVLGRGDVDSVLAGRTRPFFFTYMSVIYAAHPVNHSTGECTFWRWEGDTNGWDRSIDWFREDTVSIFTSATWTNVVRKSRLSGSHPIVESGTGPDICYQLAGMGLGGGTAVYDQRFIQFASTFTVSFDVWVSSGPNKAEALWFFFGSKTIPQMEKNSSTDSGGQGGFQLVFSVFETYTGGAGRTGTGIYLFNPNNVAVQASSAFSGRDAWVPVTVTYNKGTTNTLIVNYNGDVVVRYSDANIETWLASDSSGGYWGIGARTGSLTCDFKVRRLNLSYADNMAWRRVIAPGWNASTSGLLVEENMIVLEANQVRTSSSPLNFNTSFINNRTTVLNGVTRYMIGREIAVSQSFVYNTGQRRQVNVSITGLSTSKTVNGVVTDRVNDATTQLAVRTFKNGVFGASYAFSPSSPVSVLLDHGDAFIINAFNEIGMSSITIKSGTLVFKYDVNLPKDGLPEKMDFQVEELVDDKNMFCMTDKLESPLFTVLSSNFGSIGMFNSNPRYPLHVINSRGWSDWMASFSNENTNIFLSHRTGHGILVDRMTMNDPTITVFECRNQQHTHLLVRGDGIISVGYPRNNVPFPNAQRLQVDGDTWTSGWAQFSNVKVGTVGTQHAHFAHCNHYDTSRYALKQQDDGITFLNTPNHDSIRLCVEDCEYMRMDSKQPVTVSFSIVPWTQRVKHNEEIFFKLNPSIPKSIAQITKKKPYIDGLQFKVHVSEHFDDNVNWFFGKSPRVTSFSTDMSSIASATNNVIQKVLPVFLEEGYPWVTTSYKFKLDHPTSGSLKVSKTSTDATFLAGDTVASLVVYDGADVYKSSVGDRRVAFFIDGLSSKSLCHDETATGKITFERFVPNDLKHAWKIEHVPGEKWKVYIYNDFNAKYIGYDSATKKPVLVSSASKVKWSIIWEPFSVEWTGVFVPDETGNWKFNLQTDDAAYLWLEDGASSGFTRQNAFVDNGGAHTLKKVSSTKYLYKDEIYDMRVQFGSKNNNQTFELSFERPSEENTPAFNGHNVYYGSKVDGVARYTYNGGDIPLDLSLTDVSWSTKSIANGNIQTNDPSAEVNLVVYNKLGKQVKTISRNVDDGTYNVQIQRSQSFSFIKSDSGGYDFVEQGSALTLGMKGGINTGNVGIRCEYPTATLQVSPRAEGIFPETNGIYIYNSNTDDLARTNHAILGIRTARDVPYVALKCDHTNNEWAIGVDSQDQGKLKIHSAWAFEDNDGVSRFTMESNGYTTFMNVESNDNPNTHALIVRRCDVQNENATHLFVRNDGRIAVRHSTPLTNMDIKGKVLVDDRVSYGHPDFGDVGGMGDRLIIKKGYNIEGQNRHPISMGVEINSEGDVMWSSVPETGSFKWYHNGGLEVMHLRSNQMDLRAQLFAYVDDPGSEPMDTMEHNPGARVILRRTDNYPFAIGYADISRDSNHMWFATPSNGHFRWYKDDEPIMALESNNVLRMTVDANPQINEKGMIACGRLQAHGKVETSNNPIIMLDGTMTTKQLKFDYVSYGLPVFGSSNDVYGNNYIGVATGYSSTGTRISLQNLGEDKYPFAIGLDYNAMWHSIPLSNNNVNKSPQRNSFKWYIGGVDELVVDNDNIDVRSNNIEMGYGKITFGHDNRSKPQRNAQTYDSNLKLNDGTCIVYKKSADISMHYPWAAGVESDALWHSVPFDAKHRWYIDGIQELNLDSNQLDTRSNNVEMGFGKITFGGQNSSGPKRDAQTYVSSAKERDGTCIVFRKSSDTVNQFPWAAGVEDNALWHSVPSSGNHRWYIHGVQEMNLNSNQLDTMSNNVEMGYGKLTFGGDNRSDPKKTAQSYDSNAKLADGTCVIYRKSANTETEYPCATGVTSVSLWNSVPQRNTFDWFINGEKELTLDDTQLDMRSNNIDMGTGHIIFKHFPMGLLPSTGTKTSGSKIILEEAKTERDATGAILSVGFPHAIGSSNNQTWISVPWKASICFYVNGLNVMRIRSANALPLNLDSRTENELDNAMKPGSLVFGSSNLSEESFAGNGTKISFRSNVAFGTDSNSVWFYTESQNYFTWKLGNKRVLSMYRTYVSPNNTTQVNNQKQWDHTNNLYMNYLTTSRDIETRKASDPIIVLSDQNNSDIYSALQSGIIYSDNIYTKRGAKVHTTGLNINGTEALMQSTHAFSLSDRHLLSTATDWVTETNFLSYSKTVNDLKVTVTTPAVFDTNVHNVINVFNSTGVAFGTPRNLTLKLNAEIVLVSYAFSTTGTSDNRDKPKSWILYGTNNVDSSWTELSNKTNIAWSSTGTKQTFPITTTTTTGTGTTITTTTKNNDKPFKFYRFEFTEYWAGNTIHIMNLDFVCIPMEYPYSGISLYRNTTDNRYVISCKNSIESYDQMFASNQFLCSNNARIKNELRVDNLTTINRLTAHTDTKTISLEANIDAWDVRSNIRLKNLNYVQSSNIKTNKIYSLNGINDQDVVNGTDEKIIVVNKIAFNNILVSHDDENKFQLSPSTGTFKCKKIRVFDDATFPTGDDDNPNTDTLITNSNVRATMSTSSNCIAQTFIISNWTDKVPDDLTTHKLMIFGSNTNTTPQKSVFKFEQDVYLSNNIVVANEASGKTATFTNVKGTTQVTVGSADVIKLESSGKITCSDIESTTATIQGNLQVKVGTTTYFVVDTTGTANGKITCKEINAERNKITCGSIDSQGINTNANTIKCGNITSSGDLGCVKIVTSGTIDTTNSKITCGDIACTAIDSGNITCKALDTSGKTINTVQTVTDKGVTTITRGTITCGDITATESTITCKKVTCTGDLSAVNIVGSTSVKTNGLTLRNTDGTDLQHSFDLGGASTETKTLGFDNAGTVTCKKLICPDLDVKKSKFKDIYCDNIFSPNDATNTTATFKVSGAEVTCSGLTVTSKNAQNTVVTSAIFRQTDTELLKLNASNIESKSNIFFETEIKKHLVYGTLNDNSNLVFSVNKGGNSNVEMKSLNVKGYASFASTDGSKILEINRKDDKNVELKQVDVSKVYANWLAVIPSESVKESGTISCQTLYISKLFNARVQDGMDKDGITPKYVDLMHIHRNNTKSVEIRTLWANTIRIWPDTSQPVEGGNFYLPGKITFGGTHTIEYTEDTTVGTTVTLGLFSFNRKIWCAKDISAEVNIDCKGTMKCANLEASTDVKITSDARSKENVSNITNALDTICKLQGRYFNYINDTKRRIGLIAQEVEGILPEIVNEASETTGLMSLSYANITALLIEGIKDLKAELDEIKTYIKERRNQA